MKRLLACAILGAVMAAPPLAGQQQAPTLGPQGSSPGHSTKATVNRQRLLAVRALYIDRIDNGLSARLLNSIGNLGWARIVADPGKADAILRGTCFDSRRLKELHSEVFINDRLTGASIWQDVVRVPAYPPPLGKAVAQTAARVAGDLSDSIQGAADH